MHKDWVHVKDITYAAPKELSKKFTAQLPIVRRSLLKNIFYSITKLRNCCEKNYIFLFQHLKMRLILDLHFFNSLLAIRIT
jgi:hypothetical protein